MVTKHFPLIHYTVNYFIFIYSLNLYLYNLNPLKRVNCVKPLYPLENLIEVSLHPSSFRRMQIKVR